MRNEGMQQTQIQWNPDIWRRIRIAAINEGIPAAEFVRRATTARLLNVEKGDMEGVEGNSAAEAVT